MIDVIDVSSSPVVMFIIYTKRWSSFNRTAVDNANFVCLIFERNSVILLKLWSVRELENIPLTEWLALQTFYKFTNGLHWHYKGPKTNSTHWNFTDYRLNNPCFDKWAGVTCTCFHHSQIHYYNSGTYGGYNYDDDFNNLPTSNIQKLVLVKYNLTGFITSDISKLQNLTILILFQNHLTGKFQKSCGH